MFAALVLAGIIAAPLGTAALLVRGRHRFAAIGTWPSIRRFAFAIGGIAILAAIVLVALRLLGVTQHNSIDAIAALAIASLVWLPVTRRWNARAYLCWSSSIFLFVVYLAFVLDWTFASHLGAAGTAGGLLLWLLEVFAAILACAYLWEICDALGSERWRRRITRAAPARLPDSELPFISLHVPAHNEPPDMVIETLRSLLRLDYPRYEVIVIDDNTDDELLWRPVQQWCARHGAKFAHLEDWPGYKSGALNYALRELTDERAEIIGVVDSDYQLAPGFLRRCAPLFAESWVGFTQAPQDYRDWEHARYYRRLYYSYQYFFAVSQPSRNERDGAIFAGTMGLIRRVALEQLGGWDEWCITEDAELSLRLLRAGWSGLHVDETWGKGIMPLTFEALKGQRYRWCFGGIQILRMHWRSLLPGRETKENRLSTGQRWSYLTGALQWYGDLLGLVFLVFLLAGAANLATGGGELFRKLTVFLVATVPVLVLLGLVRAVALLRRGTGASWRDALGASSSGSPRRWWWPGPRCWRCSPARPPFSAPRRPASRSPGGKRCARTGPRRRWRCWACSGSPPRSPSSASFPGRCWRACSSFRRSAWPRPRSTAGPHSGPRCRRRCGSGARPSGGGPATDGRSCAARRSAGSSPWPR